MMDIVHKTVVFPMLALLLGACVADGGTGGSLLQAAVGNQCRTELNKRSEWRMVTLAVTAEQKQIWENKICGCVSEEAPKQATTAEWAQILNPATREQAAASVALKTLTACVQRLAR